jgi:GntR family transcriptional regulator
MGIMSPSSSPFAFRLDPSTGVPVYRQIIDQILGAVASGTLRPGDQLPTVRQLAVELAINPNTVIRAYRELEIRGALTTQQGIGTFISQRQIPPDQAERQARLSRLVADLLARAGAEGFTAEELLSRLQDHLNP